MTVSLRFKSFFAILMAAVLLLLPNTSAFAADPPAQIKINYQSQEKSQWCWAAVSVMLLDVFGIKMTQSQYAQYANGHTQNVTIMDFEFRDALEGKGITGKMTPGPATPAQIKASIDRKEPVVVFQKFKRTGVGHLVIINGYFEKPGDNNLYLWINNPSKQVGVQDWYTYEEMKTDKSIQWTQSLINIKKTN
ncbi:C39 family peptidase [uncultured Brevibacillus sp.]|uniref:C39 family peptidase n=1 Tax=uncultured Brevibacillus sp. TaxID=169970 RepID=UPI002598FCCE|nr:papain-like cysteine protease family protein [uncultured Brevibacillus sp.]